jgi:hypothetical protein
MSGPLFVTTFLELNFNFNFSFNFNASASDRFCLSNYPLHHILIGPQFKLITLQRTKPPTTLHPPPT